MTLQTLCVGPDVAEDGWVRVCRELREKVYLPILMLTAKDDVIDKVLGLELARMITLPSPLAFANPKQ